MPPRPTQHIQKRRADNVRIGPISIITLIIVICMAVMGVLAASTSHATQAISNIAKKTGLIRLWKNFRTSADCRMTPTEDKK